MKNDLEKQVAELFFQLRGIGAVQCVENLVGLFYEHRLEALPCLLFIPGAAIFPPQALNQIYQLLNVRSLVHSSNISPRQWEDLGARLRVRAPGMKGVLDHRAAGDTKEKLNWLRMNTDSPGAAWPQPKQFGIGIGIGVDIGIGFAIPIPIPIPTPTISSMRSLPK
jgi:hypothetical protein